MRKRLLLSILLFVLAAGCSPQSTLDAAGPAALEISRLSWFVYIVFCAVAVTMWILLVWAALRRRGSFAEHQPIDVTGGQSWIITGGFLVPFIILAAIF